MRTLILIFFAAACADGQQIPAPAVRDSAGVRIVEHRTIKTAQIAFTVSPASSVDLGGLKDDPKGELDAGDPFPNAVRLSDGRYVASTRTALKFFDRTGKYIRTVGREGDGPGEFRQNREVCRTAGDTLVVLPYSGRQVSVFDSAGKHVRSFKVMGGFLRGPCFDDGTLILSTNYRVNPATQMSAQEASALDRIQDLVRLRPDGTQLAVMTSAHLEVYAPPSTHPNAFAKGRMLYVGDGRATEFRVYSSEGKLAQIVRWQDPLVKADGTNREVEDARGSPARAPTRQAGLGIVPAYSEIIADDAGRIWVEDYVLSNPIGNWTVFASDGRLLGRVITPTIPGADPKMLEIVRPMRDQVIVSWREKDTGALHLSIHALTPAKQ